ncbi:hypothetical protein [Candidatus Protochlamydia phocaeensis]|uniref:hypothetical protein n=1 Tax=Candidatus Protochlamydia phocaeensis TaxID=1414722 RepID=UPI0008392C47|nr:hypothetical protein [Candidatus Protochlamydia phocaeensis]
MSNLFLTLVIAFVLIVIAIACLAIGWLITGKTKIERGSCGRDPTKKRSPEECGHTSCDLCMHPDLKAQDSKEAEREDKENHSRDSTPTS